MKISTFQKLLWNRPADTGKYARLQIDKRIIKHSFLKDMGHDDLYVDYEVLQDLQVVFITLTKLEN